METDSVQLLSDFNSGSIFTNSSYCFLFSFLVSKTGYSRTAYQFVNLEIRNKNLKLLNW